MCFGGGSAPTPPAPPPPPQYAQAATPAAVRANTAAQVGAQTNNTLLTGGQGSAVSSDTLGKKTLLGS